MNDDFEFSKDEEQKRILYRRIRALEEKNAAFEARATATEKRAEYYYEQVEQLYAAIFRTRSDQKVFSILYRLGANENAVEELREWRRSFTNAEGQSRLKVAEQQARALLDQLYQLRWLIMVLGVVAFSALIIAGFTVVRLP